MQEEELFRQTVEAYEERINEFIAENVDLRKALGNLAKELQDALNRHGVSDEQMQTINVGVSVSSCLFLFFSFLCFLGRSHARFT